MFDKKEYREMFSQVRASEGTRREVLNMAKMENNPRGNGIRGRRLAMLAAAVIMLTAMTLTAFASEEVQSWFVRYFARQSENELSEGQVEYIQENELAVLDSQSHDGWTVELRSAISDGTTAYVVFRVEGPEDADLTTWTDEQGNTLGSFTFGNMTTSNVRVNNSEIVIWPEDVYLQSWSFNWINDGDGLSNTRSFVIRLEPDMKRVKTDPFGAEAVYRFHIENIVWEYEDLAYRRELMNGKYAGQSGVMFTQEELEKLYRAEVQVEGVWDFSLCFDDQEDVGADLIELLSAPVTTMASFLRITGPEMDDFVIEEDTVTLTSVRMNHLTVRFCYRSVHDIPNLTWFEGDQEMCPQVVLKDGTALRLLPHANAGNGSLTLAAEQPIVFEEVDYILMVDGTIIDMPE